MERELRVLFVTSQWPSAAHPHNGIFVRREVEYLRRIGVDVDVLAYSGGPNPLAYARAILRFRRQLRSNGYDVVHGRFGQTSLVVFSQRRVPVVVTYGGTDVLGRKDEHGRHVLYSYPQRAISLIGARLADEVILVSRNLGEYVGRSDFHVVPAGVDLDLFRPIDKTMARRQLGWDQKRFYVLFVANPEKPLKRYWLAREAMGETRGLFPHEKIQLVVVHGEHPEKVPLYMAAADALLLTSVHEGSPNVVKEALACNLPVVSVDVGDVRERIRGVEGCFLCEDDSPTALAAAIKSVVQRDEPIDGRSAVSALDSRLMAERMLDVYRKAINARSAAWELRDWDGYE